MKTALKFPPPWLIPLFVFSLMATGAGPPAAAESLTWPEAVARSHGQTVDWIMPDGCPQAGAYVRGYVAPRVKELYGITLRQVPVTTMSEVVGKLLNEKQGGENEGGEVDLLWFNGKNFGKAKTSGLLFGPFADTLPNRRLVDWNRPLVANDFGEPLENMASPWGLGQFVMIYDLKRTPQPPGTMADLFDWIREHPGRFAYPAPPDATGSAFVRQVFYHVSGNAVSWQGPPDTPGFEKAASDCYRLLRDIAPFLWQAGRSYPESPARLNRLFAEGEIDFSMSYCPADAAREIADGRYPDSVRTFLFQEGTVAGTHFVAIPFNAADKAAAMVVANFLLTPEAQLKKADPLLWGDLPIIDTSRLDYAWREKFKSLPRGSATLPDSILRERQLPEPASAIVINLEEGWQLQVLQQR